MDLHPSKGQGHPQESRTCLPISTRCSLNQMEALMVCPQSTGGFFNMAAYVTGSLQQMLLPTERYGWGEKEDTHKASSMYVSATRAKQPSSWSPSFCMFYLHHNNLGWPTLDAVHATHSNLCLEVDCSLVHGNPLRLIRMKSWYTVPHREFIWVLSYF